MLSIQKLPLIGASCSGQRFQSPSRPGGNVLGNPMIMVSTNGTCRVFADPFHTRYGIGAIVDQISQNQAGVERLIDRAQCGPIGVDVGEYQDSHDVRRGMGGMDCGSDTQLLAQDHSAWGLVPIVSVHPLHSVRLGETVGKPVRNRTRQRSPPKRGIPATDTMYRNIM